MQSTLTHPYSQDIRSNFRYLVASIFHSKTFVLAAVALGLLANLPSVQAQGSGGDLSGIAEREIARRANLVVEADKALALGRTAYSKSQYQEAVNQYRIAVNLLPPGPALADRHQPDQRPFRLASCRCLLARWRCVAPGSQHPGDQGNVGNQLCFRNQHPANRIAGCTGCQIPSLHGRQRHSE